MNKIHFMIVVVLLLYGCSVAPMKVDVGIFNGNTLSEDNNKKPTVNSFKLINKAENESQMEGGVSDALMPVRTNPSSKTIVEADINEYLEKNLTIDTESIFSISVYIINVDTFYATGTGDAIPFFNFVTVGAKRDFLLRLNIRFEVEENNKVVRTYIYDDAITLKDGVSATEKTKRDSYERLIELFRKEFFSTLDKEFIYRYL